MRHQSYAVAKIHRKTTNGIENAKGQTAYQRVGKDIDKKEDKLKPGEKSIFKTEKLLGVT